MFILIAAMLACNCPIERRFWMLTRSGHWFEMVKTVFTDKEWYDNFRVSKETFQNIVSEIEDEIVRKDTAMRKAISSRKKLVWHVMGQSFTLHISSEPGRGFGNAYQFHPCSDYLSSRSEHG